jgi:hypothetical protein
MVLYGATVALVTGHRRRRPRASEGCLAPRLEDDGLVFREQYSLPGAGETG